MKTMSAIRPRYQLSSNGTVLALLCCSILLFALTLHAKTATIAHVSQKERHSYFPQRRIHSNPNRHPLRRLTLFRARYPSVTPARSRGVQATAAVQPTNLRQTLAASRRYLTLKRTSNRSFNNNIRENDRKRKTQVMSIYQSGAMLKGNRKTIRTHTIPANIRLRSPSAEPLSKRFHLRRMATRKRPLYKTRLVRTRAKMFGNATVYRSNNSRRLMFYPVHNSGLIGRTVQRKVPSRSAQPFTGGAIVNTVESSIDSRNNLPIFSVQRIRSLPSRNRFRFRNFSSEDLANTEDLNVNHSDDLESEQGVGPTIVANYGRKSSLSPIDPLHANPGRSTTDGNDNSTDDLTLSFNSSMHWWRGENVCLVEKPGLFSGLQKILKKVETRKRCVEKKEGFECTEMFDIGGHLPVKTIAYQCCPGYALTGDRRECLARSELHLDSGSPPAGSVLLNRVNHFDSPITRAAPADDIFTIFMPNNDVVEAVFMEEENVIGADEHARSFFENHVILNKKILSTQIENNQIFTAFSGNPIRVNFIQSDFDVIMTANCRKVSTVDVISGNSILHFIDDIIDEVKGSLADYLLEKQDIFSTFIDVLRNSGLMDLMHSSNGSFTLFAPTNDAFASFPVSNDPGKCLEAFAHNHIVDSIVCSAGIEDVSREFTTLHNESMMMRQIDDVKYVGKARITQYDVMATNGVIHVIDKVLRPSAVSSMLDIMSPHKQFTMMLKMFQLAGIKDALATGNNFTLIAPTNRAFKEMSKSEFLRLTTYVEDLRSVLMFHLIPFIVEENDLRPNKTLESLNPPHGIHVSSYPMKMAMHSKGQLRYLRKQAVAFQCARVIGKPKTMPCNGALYFVDKVILPPSGTLLSAMMYSKHSNFTTLLKAIRLTKLEHIFDGGDLLTMFAPSEAAFNRFPTHVARSLLENRQLLARVIKFHLVPDLIRDVIGAASAMHREASAMHLAKRNLLPKRRQKLYDIDRQDIVASTSFYNDPIAMKQFFDQVLQVALNEEGYIWAESERDCVLK